MRMRFSPTTRATRAAAAGVGLATVLASTFACSTTEVLGPPDAIECTAGALRPTVGAPDTISSRIDAERCRRFSTITLENAYAESWTLTMEPFTAYVIRLLPSETTPGVVPFRGVLSAFARNAEGDAGLVSLGQINKDDDIANAEIVIATASRRTISLRVEGRNLNDQGPYRLAIEQCPVRDLPLDSTVTGVGTAASCLARSWAGTPRRLTFASVAVERQGVHRFFFERTAGNAAIRSAVAGPELDLMRFDDRSLRLRAPIATDEYLLLPEISVPGRYTFVFETHPDSGATLRASVGPRPLTESIRLP